MNILLTSAGRRSYLCGYFREALRGEGLVFACNSEMSPALLSADRALLSPLIYSPDYIPFLLGLCRKERIGLLVPLFDIDLPVIAAHREEFLAAGTVPAVSDPGVLGICSDKRRMAAWLTEKGFHTPAVYDGIPEDADGKDFTVKPRCGMGSISVLEAKGRDELSGAVSMCRRAVRDSYLKYESMRFPGEDVLITDFIRGQEYGLDVVNDFSGRFRAVVVRKKLGMRAGETDEAVVLGEEDEASGLLFALGERLGRELGHRGNLDADVIMDKEGRAFVIDLNARFGGGYPFSHAAGADLPLAYVLWAKGEEAPEACFAVRPGTHAYKDITMGVYA